MLGQKIMLRMTSITEHAIRITEEQRNAGLLSKMNTILLKSITANFGLTEEIDCEREPAKKNEKRV